MKQNKIINGFMPVTKEELSERGIEEFVEDLNKGKNTLHSVLSFNGTKDKIDVEISMQYTDTYNENIVSFVNNVKTIDGGSH